MAHTDRWTVVAIKIRDIIDAQKGTLGIEKVYYGDQRLIPESIAVVIMPLPKIREISGVAGPGGRSMNNMELQIDVLNSTVGIEEEERLRVDRISEELEELLHEDTTLAGIIIHGYIRTMDPGTVVREGSQFRVVRMTYYCKTKTNITQ